MKASDWVLARPWAITEDALGVILAIAERRNESPQAVEAKLGRPLDNTHRVTVRDGVAIVPVVGPISRYADFFTEISGATSIDTLARDFHFAVNDRSVRAVILDVDSPGGTVAGVSEFASQVRSARAIKPVVAYVGSLAASAGYWIASAAEQVVADSTAMLGSIGVVMGVPRKKATDPIEIVSSQSPYKRLDAETETGKAHLQATADELADLFVDAVAASRGVSRESVLADFGRGGCLVASKAVAAGMADGIGSLEETIASLARGDMPCGPMKKKAAPKSQSNPREPAMSEPTTTPAAGDQTNAEIERLRADLAAAREDAAAKASANSDLLTRSIETEARAFAAEIITAQCKAVPGERQTIVDAMTLALRDDHDHPIAGRPTARQDSLRAVYEKRTAHTLTRERGSADPKAAGRALASDPASDADAADPEAAAAARAARADREERKKRNQAALGKMAAAE
jgi:signal peptide peptidase SppA